MTDAPAQTWWTAAEIAEARLPDMPTTKRRVNDLARRQGWASQPGKVRRRKAYKSHILTKKSQKRKRNLRKSTIMEGADARQIMRLIPYK